MSFGDSSKFARKGQAPNVGAQLGSWKIRLIASLHVGLLALAISAPAPNDVAVVVHPAVTVDDLTFGELRQIFLADKIFWSSKLRVTILIPAGRERMVVLKTVYQMTEAQFRQFWISKLFRAEAVASPKIVDTDEMAIELVTAIPGAIAVVDAAHVPSRLKVLRIDGRRPGDKGYPLH
ncbi:MAG TPA: hypothetical protein VNY05_46240 [Candidatus Acidoferrales bacterium]|jgi:hypothetical protein|nr:hypothetical protein [Candidatus Acidoferrales bacterium]